MSTTERPRPLQIIAAFAAIYFIWGSTYLFIRFAIESLPPFGFAGVRFFTSGALLYAFLRLRKAEQPTKRQWLNAFVVGCFLCVGGNAFVVWSEKSVDSGLVSLLVSATPLWMVLFDWLRPNGNRPNLRVVLSLLLGLAGLSLLLHPGVSPNVDIGGCLLAICGSLCWSFGSIYSRNVELPKNPIMSTAAQMMCAGLVLGTISVFTGEPQHFHLGHITLKSALSVAYLILFGSIVAYSAYVWLIRIENPARVATYAYVNPVVALLLGWMFAGEHLSLSMLLPIGIILSSVVLVTRATGAQKNAKTELSTTDGGTPEEPRAPVLSAK